MGYQTHHAITWSLDLWVFLLASWTEHTSNAVVLARNLNCIMCQNSPNLPRKIGHSKGFLRPYFSHFWPRAFCQITLKPARRQPVNPIFYRRLGRLNHVRSPRRVGRLFGVFGVFGPPLVLRSAEDSLVWQCTPSLVAPASTLATLTRPNLDELRELEGSRDKLNGFCKNELFTLTDNSLTIIISL